MNFIKLILITVFSMLASFSVQAQLTTGTVDFDVDNLHSMQQITVSLSDDTELILILDYIVEHTPDSYTWVGSVQSDATSRAFITVNKPNAVGTIQTTYSLYELTITEVQSDPVKQIDPSNLPNEADPLQSPIFRSGFESGEGGVLKSLGSIQAVCDDTSASIDVLVLYTDDADRASGDIEAKIRQAITMANDSYLKSHIVSGEPDGIDLKLNLVHMQMVDVEEGADSNYAKVIGDFQKNGEEEGFLDEVHTLRNQFNADLSVLIFESGTVCGRAFSDIVGPEENGFAVVKRECLDDHTFTHEIGHLFGAWHDKYALNSPPYSGSHYGYTHIGLFTGWLTIMAYKNECHDAPYVLWCPRPGFFLAQITNTTVIQLELKVQITENNLSMPPIQLLAIEMQRKALLN